MNGRFRRDNVDSHQLCDWRAFAATWTRHVQRHIASDKFRRGAALRVRTFHGLIRGRHHKPIELDAIKLLK